MVDRRRAEELRQQDTIKKYFYLQLTDFAFQALCISGFTMFWFAPELFNSERNPDCEMRCDLANAMFAWVLLGLDACISLTWMLFYGYKRLKDVNSQIMFEFIEQATIV